MTIIRQAIVLSAALVLAGCHDFMSPRSWLTGTYQLVLLNSAVLPVPGNGLQSGTVRFSDDGTYEQRLVYQGIVAGQTDEIVSKGDWRLNGTLIEDGFRSPESRHILHWYPMGRLENLEYITLYVPTDNDGNDIGTFRRD
jgi:hypothetical protein